MFYCLALLLLYLEINPLGKIGGSLLQLEEDLFSINIKVIVTSSCCCWQSDHWQPVSNVSPSRPNWPSRTSHLPGPGPPPLDTQLELAGTGFSKAAGSLQWCGATACRCTRRCRGSPCPARQRSSRSSLLAASQRSCVASYRGSCRAVACRGRRQVLLRHGAAW